LRRISANVGVRQHDLGVGDRRLLILWPIADFGKMWSFADIQSEAEN
jgi:hypothetical protein